MSARSVKVRTMCFLHINIRSMEIVSHINIHLWCCTSAGLIPGVHPFRVALCDMGNVLQFVWRKWSQCHNNKKLHKWRMRTYIILSLSSLWKSREGRRRAENRDEQRIVEASREGNSSDEQSQTEHHKLHQAVVNPIILPTPAAYVVVFGWLTRLHQPEPASSAQYIIATLWPHLLILSLSYCLFGITLVILSGNWNWNTMETYSHYKYYPWKVTYRFCL